MAAQKWLNPKCKGRLPRGSMGLPIIGETIPFFSPHSFYGIPHFISKRMTKYGSVLKTSLVGNLVVVSGDSELNQYIFKEGKSVYCSYKESALKIMGEQSLLAYHGVFHKYLKNLTLSMIGPESLKEVLLHETDAITRKYLHSCSNYASFDVKEESANQLINWRMWVLVICLIAFLVILISQWLQKWLNPKCKGRLPRGSMGLPIIGETIQFFSPHSFYGIPPFISKRMTKYGSVFKTSLVGNLVVVSGDSELNQYIFKEEGKSVYCSYTESALKIMGEQSLLAYHGVFHKYLKNLTLSMIGPESLKEVLLHEMDAMVFEYFAKKLFGYEEAKASKKLRESYKAFLDGLISFPLNIPGTAFHACLKGRENAIKVINNVINERKSSQKLCHDFLDFLLEEAKSKDTILNEAIIVDLVFLLLFASYETTSEAITLVMKFLSDHPSVVVELTKEHEEILKNRKNEELGITWTEYKSMTFTHMVINETLRLGNIVPGIFRGVTKDIEMKGTTIPAGSTVMVCPSAVHLNPAKYNDPLAFDPWRWEGQELHAGSKNFVAFGGGSRLCAGAHFAKVQVAVFLHYLVTKYRWKKIRGGDIIRKPGLVFPDGLHIQISAKYK
ncbi:unnamed protein product, partial [Vitis vinifera]